MNNKIKAAAMFAEYAHKGQLRKYTGEPYFNHVEAVANIVRSASDSNSVIAIAAAYLHDIVEDTDITIEFIRALFDDYIASVVGALTDVSRPRDGNRKIRKALDRTHNARGNLTAKIIKLADFIDNAKTIIKFDPDFARIYMKEKRLLLTAFKENDPAIINKKLWKVADKQLLDWEAEIRYAKYVLEDSP